MSTVVISSDACVEEYAPCQAMLHEAGFEDRLVVDLQFSRGHAPDEQVIEILGDAVAVIAWGEKYPERILAALPALRVVARAGVGFDNVDVAAATALGKVVTIAPNANHEAVSEHALTMILALAKSIVTGDRAMRAGNWRGYSRTPVRGKTLGIVGLGRIGRSLAVRALALRMKVIAAEKFPDVPFVEQHGIELLDLDELLARADYVSLHCPLNDETRGIINARTLAKMRPGSRLINTARGGLVVEADLGDALRRGHLGGVGLDVFAQEPTIADHPLFEFENALVSPHVAGNDVLAMQDMGKEAAQCIIDLSQGKWPEEAVVNRELKGKWTW